VTRNHDESAVRNVISFDTEHWYSATLLSSEVSDPVDHVHDSVEVTLEILERHDVRATFFIVGKLAQEYPDLVSRIADAGHEIGSHGQTHTPLFDLTPDAFRSELQRSVEHIQAATGQRPIGFRAPNFSITPETRWAFEILEDEGFVYDSSVFPVRTPMYGVAGSPKHPYVAATDAPFAPTTDRPESAEVATPAGSSQSVDAPVAVAPDDEIVELPPAVFHPRLPVPVAGGFYARLLPTWVVNRGVENLNRAGVPAIIYFHPWELNPDVVRDDIPLHKRFVSFHGIEDTRETLRRLLSSHNFGTARSILPRATRA
jgi:polysaccharide deacetylase family protein (PEP-CTERM system associated)